MEDMFGTSCSTYSHYSSSPSLGLLEARIGGSCCNRARQDIREAVGGSCEQLLQRPSAGTALRQALKRQISVKTGGKTSSCSSVVSRK